MAGSLASINIKFFADLKQFSSEMQNATRSMKKMGKEITDVGATMSFALTAPLVGLGTLAVANAIKFEKLATSLNVLAGGAEKGAIAFKRLEEFAAATPFEMEELVTVNNTLLGFGQTTDQAYDSLKMLADMAAISGSDLRRLSIAFGQSAAMGRVMTMDLTQFINNGVPVYKLLGDITGKTSGELRKMAERGEISFEMLNAAFRKATTEGGLFFEGTAKLGQTLGGRMSTMKDNVALALKDMGVIIGEYIRPLVEWITKLASKFRDLSPETKKIIVVIAALAAVIGPLLIALGFMMTTVVPGLIVVYGFLTAAVSATATAFGTLNTMMLANPVVAIAAGIAAITYGLIELVQSITPAVSKLQTLFNLIKAGGNTLSFQAYQMRDQMEGMAKQEIAAKAAAAATKAFNDKQKEAADVTAKATAAIIKQASFLGGGTGTGSGSGSKGKAADKENYTFRFKTTGTSQFSTFASDMIASFKTATTAVEETLSEFELASEKIINGGIMDTFTSLGEAIGDSFANGGNVLQAAGQVIIASLGGILMQFGKLIIAAGIASETFATMMKNPFGGGIAAIAAGIALVAIGAAVKSFGGKKSKSNSYADGGVVGGNSFYGDKLMSFLNSGETVINRNQQEKLYNAIQPSGQNITVGLNGEFKMNGQDMLLLVERAQARKNRTS